MSAIPRPAALIARAHLAIVVLLAIAGIAGGVGMHLELWTPGAFGTPERYEHLLRLHGTLAFAFSAPALLGSFGHAVVLAGRAERLRVPLLGWLGVACFAVATCGLVAMVIGEPPALPSFETPIGLRLVEVGFPIAGLVTGVHVLAQVPRVAIGRSSVAIGFVLAAMTACVASLAGHDQAQQATLLAAVALGAAVVMREGWHRPGTWFALAAIPHVLLVVYAELVLREADVYLHDTYSAVGRYHAHAAVLVLAALAALHCWAEPLVGRRPRPRIVLAGLAIATLSGMAHHIALLRLGSSGMPRRYWDYDPVFESMHQVAAVEAIVALVGVATIAVGWLIRATARSPLP